MTSLYEYAGLFVVVLWVLYRILRLILPKNLALIASLGTIAIGSLLSPDTAFIQIAVFAPLGAVLPALAIQNFAKHHLNYQPTTFQIRELALALILYVLFLCAALGVFPFDPYRYGYFPAFGSVLAFVLLGYTLWRKHHALAAAVIVGQLAWVFDVASTNYFDHITHALLVPVILVSLIKTTVAKACAK